MPLDEIPVMDDQALQEAKAEFERAKHVAADLFMTVSEKTGKNTRFTSQVFSIVMSAILTTVFKDKPDGALERGLAAFVVSTINQTSPPCCDDPIHLLSHCFGVLSTVFTDEMVLNALARALAVVTDELVEKGSDRESIFAAVMDYMQAGGGGVLRSVEIDETETKH